MIMSDRDEFIGAHTTEDAKQALEKERKLTGKSVSLLVHEAIVSKLREKGYEIKEQTAA